MHLLTFPAICVILVLYAPRRQWGVILNKRNHEIFLLLFAPKWFGYPSPVRLPFHLNSLRSHINSYSSTHMKKLLFLCLSFFCILPLIATATTRYVRPFNPSAAAPYTTWETAATRIQDAVDVADPGDTILVTNGIYLTGSRATPGHSLLNRLVIDKDVTVTSVNGPSGTIILGANDIRGVFMTAGEIDGFSISGNTYLTGDEVYELSGGGIWLTNGCVVNNCVVFESSAQYGGGIYLHSRGTVRNSTLINNTALYDGGGMYCNDGGGTHNISTTVFSNNTAGARGGALFHRAVGTLIRCDFFNNHCDGDGGALYLHDTFGISVQHGHFARNNAVNGGAVAVAAPSAHVSFSSVLFTANVARATHPLTTIGGGAIATAYGARTFVQNSHFVDNISSNHGGAISAFLSQLTVLRSTFYPLLAEGIPNKFVGNRALNQGGAIMIVSNALHSSISHTLIQNNHADGIGGALYLYSGGNATIENTVIARNTAAERDGVGLAEDAYARLLYCTVAYNGSNGITANYNSSIVVSNCIVWGHAHLNIEYNHDVQYSNIEGGYPTGNGNIPHDPLFADPDNNDFQLLEPSPGRNIAWNIGITNDCIGVSRPYGAGYDMGAYEFVPEPVLGILLLSLLVGSAYRRHHHT